MNILIWHGKHGDAYYDASTPEAREASAVQILEEWTQPNYSWVPEPEDPMKHIQYSGIDMEQANLTDEQIAALPTETLRKDAQRHKDSLARRISNYEAEKEDYILLMRVVAGERPLMPWRRRRKDTTDEEWAEIVERLAEKFPDAVVEGDRVRKPVTAWSLVQQYGEGEYMQVSEESVWTPKEDDE